MCTPAHLRDSRSVGAGIRLLEMVSPVQGSNDSVKGRGSSTFATKYRKEVSTSNSKNLGPGRLTNAPEANKRAIACHGPEDWQGDQTLVGSNCRGGPPRSPALSA